MVYRYYLKINGEKYCQNFKLKEFVCKDKSNKILSDSFFCYYKTAIHNR